MTSFKHVFQATWQPKFRTANLFVFFELLAIVLTMVYEIWHGGLTNLEMVGPVVGWGSLFGFIICLLVTFKSEKMLVSDTYRLLPASDTKLYLTSQLTSLLIFLYTAVIQAVLLVIGLAMTGNSVRTWFRLNMNLHLTAQNWHQIQVYGFSVTLWGLAVILWLLVFITLIHLGTEAISAFIPGASQKVVKLILGIVLIWAVIAFMNLVSHLENNLMRIVSDSGVVNMNLDLAGLLIGVLLVGALNIYLLHRWVEARY